MFKNTDLREDCCGERDGKDDWGLGMGDWGLGIGDWGSGMEDGRWRMKDEG